MEKFRIFRAGLDAFLSAGYLYIGMDHFARPGDELALAQTARTLHRNFQGYTTKAGADLYGLGVSAISAIGDAYAQNVRDVEGYGARIAQRGIATMRGYRLSPEDRLRRAVISRLLCHTVVRKSEIESEFGIRFDDTFAPELERLASFAADSLVVITPDEVRVTGPGRIFIRNVAMVFDPYLDRQQRDGQPLFSKTL
jgi:oxygen-independent coproporphyrinogen-3 oxidase